MRVRFYNRFETLPASYDDLFVGSARHGFCLTRPWFENLASNILGPGERLCLVGVESANPHPHGPHARRRTRRQSDQPA